LSASKWVACGTTRANHQSNAGWLENSEGLGGAATAAKQLVLVLGLVVAIELVVPGLANPLLHGLVVASWLWQSW
jgi:hypothetical protein